MGADVPARRLECRLLPAKTATELQHSPVGNQTGGRVFLFLHTDNFERDYLNLVDQQVKIVRNLVRKRWGMVAALKTSAVTAKLINLKRKGLDPSEPVESETFQASKR